MYCRHSKRSFGFNRHYVTILRGKALIKSSKRVDRQWNARKALNSINFFDGFHDVPMIKLQAPEVLSELCITSNGRMIRWQFNEYKVKNTHTHTHNCTFHCKSFFTAISSVWSVSKYCTNSPIINNKIIVLFIKSL